MRRENQSSVSEFLLLGLPVQPEKQGMYCALFLAMYLTTVLGNLLIILLIRLDSHLHTPMYFFLSHLVLTDICFSSVTAPKMLMDMLMQTQSISYAGCISQAYFFVLFGALDSFLLTSMTYDRYVAPALHQNDETEPCFLLVVVSWVLSSAIALVHTLLLARLKSSMNQTSVSEFLLLGLPVQPEEQGMFYALFLAMYLTTLLGNLLIILLIRLNSRLHTPMYFFLSHLAFSDVCLSSVTVPKMLRNMQTQHLSIPYKGCISQVYFFLLFVCVDNFLLAVMAYDRYVAICHPLHYTIIMRKEPCVLLAAGSWFFSCVRALLHTLLLSHLSFCADNTIPHYFCDLTELLKLTCSDTSLNELVILTEGGVLTVLPLSAILGSYVCIGATVLRVPSTKKICKVLSTCGSHLFLVFLYYGTLAVIYFFPSSNNSRVKDVIASVMYTVVTPMLNPFVYSLRNRDMRLALGMLYRKGVTFTK
ncbi:olfactory receptor 1J4-like [Sciurus carolinensis]|uniref:olfactory receptor 1J4-like n=1 Tax=Sciurus carolinensis TaxID=30640 RepID=UPI001FB1C875|nr:olfactory receptor 1J4-like [Sciurus carolinensis]